MKGDSRQPILEVSGLCRSFGGITAVDHCSFRVRKGSLHGIVGPNGAGKSVTFNLICGLLRPDAGEVRFMGRDITHLPCKEISRAGIGRTFQEVRIFPQLTVMENMVVGQQEKALWANFLSLFRPSRLVSELGAAAAGPERILEEVGLLRLQNELAANLSYGQRKLLEFATVMSQRPKLILLDEPVAGVNPAMIGRIMELIEVWRHRGATFVIIEHNMKVIMDACHHVIVLSQGRVIAEGCPKEIQEQEEVVEAYLGAPQ